MLPSWNEAYLHKRGLTIIFMSRSMLLVGYSKLLTAALPDPAGYRIPWCGEYTAHAIHP